MLLGLGALAVREARRLSVLRETLVAGAVVGDDTFPLIVGIALLALGAWLVVASPAGSTRVVWPSGTTRGRMLAGGATLVAYWFLVQWLGYTAGTALASTALYRAMGGYRWRTAFLLGASSTAVLYLLFRVWLRQPLPSGLLGG